MTKTFNTERLSAHRLSEANYNDFLKIESSPETMATLGGLCPEVLSREKFVKNMDHWKCYGFGAWLFYDKNGSLAGRGAIKHLLIDEIDHIEIGYALLPGYWKQGFATEIAAELVQVAKSLDLKELVCFTLPDNLGSRRVMEKVGFSYDRMITYAGWDHVLYKLAL